MSKPLSLLFINSDAFAQSLRERGHQVVTATLPGRLRGDIHYHHGESLSAVLARCPAGFQANRIVYFDDDLPVPSVTGLEDAPVGTAFISLWGHRYPSIHPQLGAMFDQVFYAQGDLSSRYHHYNERSVWFPHWTSLKAVDNVPRETEVLFHRGDEDLLDLGRERFLEEVRAHIPVSSDEGDPALRYSSSRIVLNYLPTNSLDVSVFDAMRCGAVVVTPITTQGLCDLFKPEKHFIVYREKDARDAVDKIRGLLSTPERIESLGKEGASEIARAHTEEKRALQLEELLERCARTKRPRRYYAAAYAALGEGRASLRRGEDEVGKKSVLHGADLLKKSLTTNEPFDDEVAKVVILYEQVLSQLGEGALVHELMELAGGMHLRKR